MTDAKNAQAEPSMEEILASIRRIISEDNTEAGKSAPAAVESAPAAPQPTAEPAAKPALASSSPKPDVLELTEMVNEDGNVTSLNDATPAPPRPVQTESPAVAKEDELISSTAAAAAVGALAGLQAATRNRDVEPLANGLALGDGALTLEELVRSEMRPILKAWLDEKLPGMVERLVQKEIKRITRQVDET